MREVIVLVFLATQLLTAATRSIVLFNGARVPTPPVLGKMEDQVRLNGKWLKFIVMEEPSRFMAMMNDETYWALGCYLYKNEPPPPPTTTPTKDDWFSNHVLMIRYSTPAYRFMTMDGAGKSIVMDPCGEVTMIDGMTPEQGLRMAIRLQYLNSISQENYYDKRINEIREAWDEYKSKVDRKAQVYSNYDLKTAPLDSDPAHQMALLQAISLWRLALGRPLPIEMPKLYKVPAGTCGVLQDFVACADSYASSIYVEDLTRVDARTIMMHEIGHLLGVPHIENDDLMDPTYHKKLEKPSAAAVALARIAKR